MILSYPASKALKKWYKEMCLNPKDAILFSSLFFHHLFVCPHCTLQPPFFNFKVQTHSFFHKIFLSFFNSLTGPRSYRQSQERITNTKGQRNQTSPQHFLWHPSREITVPLHAPQKVSNLRHHISRSFQFLIWVTGKCPERDTTRAPCRCTQFRNFPELRLATRLRIFQNRSSGRRRTRS